MRVVALVFVKMDFKYSYDNVSGLQSHLYYNESVGGKVNFSVKSALMDAELIV